MPFSNPTAGDLHVNRPLSNFSQKWMQSADGFVGLQGMPNNPVAKQSDLYCDFSRADFFRDEGEKLLRADGTESAGGDFELSTAPYYAHVYAFHKDISDRQRANQDDQVRLEQSATQFVTQKLMIRREVLWHDLFFAGANWGGTTNVTSWAPGGGGAPITDIRDQIRSIHGLTGLRPNKIVFGRAAWDAFLDNDDVLGRIEGGATPTQPAVVQRALVAALFEIETVMVSNGVRNTANQGATEATSFIGADSVLIYHAPTGAAIDQPSAGMQFSWTGLMGATPNGMRVKRFRMEELESDRIEGQMSFDYRITSPELGHLLTGTTS